MRVEGNRWSLRAPALFAVVVSGLAMSASGCFVESSASCVPHETADPTCFPDLTISWRLVSMPNNNAPITCAAAGNADTVTALIDGGGYCNTVVAFDSDCLATQTQGSFIAQLPDVGTYHVTLELRTGGPNGNLLSDTNILVIPVGCSGAATPVAPLAVNF